MSVFKACDIRGVVGDELDPALARRIGRSLGHMMRVRQQTHVCVGGDFRRTTPALKQALTAGLLEAGVHVCDVGLLPTPAAFFAARHFGRANVAVVTASHNPGRYNGVKFLLASQPAGQELIRELEQGLDAAPAATAGSQHTRHVVPLYEEELVAVAARVGPVTAPTASATAPLKVIVDAMAGALTEIAPRTLQSAGYRVISVCPHVDPDFSDRAPNPAHDGNLSLLTRRVPEAGADAGIAFDGDGDRVMFVDHTGCIMRPEQIAALLVTYGFEKPTVVYDLKCASLLPRAVVAAGGTPIVSPSGYGFIKRAMIERQADLGVEVSGHHFFRALGGGDDGLLTALVVLNLLRRTGLRLAEWRQTIGWPAITPDLRIPFAGDAAAAVERIAAGCGGRVTRLDGVRAEYDGGWALARPSITEPAITLRFEGRDDDHIREIVKRFLVTTPELRGQVLEKIHE